MELTISLPFNQIAIKLCFFQNSIELWPLKLWSKYIINISIFIMVTLEYAGKASLYSGKITLDEVKSFIQTTFGLKEGEFTVLYVDEQGDEITLGTEDDYEVVSSVPEGLEMLKLLVKSNKLEPAKLETVSEINLSSSETKNQDELTSQSQQDADKKKNADKKSQEDEKKAKEQLRKIKQQQKARKNAEKEALKVQAQKAKQQKILKKKIEDEQKEKEKEKLKKQKKEQKEQKKAEKDENKDKKSNEKSKEKKNKKSQQKNKQDKKKQQKQSPIVQKNEQASEKIGNLNIDQINKMIDQRVKRMIPTIKQQLKKQVAIKKGSEKEAIDEGRDLFSIGLQYPTTVQEVATMKTEALEKVKAFYQAEHVKINQRLKQEKIKAAAIEKQKKRKAQKQAKQNAINKTEGKTNDSGVKEEA